MADTQRVGYERRRRCARGVSQRGSLTSRSPPRTAGRARACCAKRRWAAPCPHPHRVQCQRDKSPRSASESKAPSQTQNGATRPPFASLLPHRALPSPSLSLSPRQIAPRVRAAMTVFLAVQCFQCQQAQVVQQRKDARFVCKLCAAARQSVRRVLARSVRAADVRRFVQRFNLQRGLAAEHYDTQLHHQSRLHSPTASASASPCESPPASPTPHSPPPLPPTPPPQPPSQPTHPARSRWRIYSALLASRGERSPSPQRQPAPESGRSPIPDHLLVTVLPHATPARPHKPSSRKRRRHNPPPAHDHHHAQQPAGAQPPTRRRRVNLPHPSPPQSPLPARSFDSNHCTVLPGDELYHEQTWP